VVPEQIAVLALKLVPFAMAQVKLGKYRDRYSVNSLIYLSAATVKEQEKSYQILAEPSLVMEELTKKQKLK
jgi:hypothetical protein